jgi:hypothetical protein
MSREKNVFGMRQMTYPVNEFGRKQLPVPEANDIILPCTSEMRHDGRFRRNLDSWITGILKPSGWICPKWTQFGVPHILHDYAFHNIAVLIVKQPETDTSQSAIRE